MRINVYTKLVCLFNKVCLHLKKIKTMRKAKQGASRKSKVVSIRLLNTEYNSLIRLCGSKARLSGFIKRTLKEQTANTLLNMLYAEWCKTNDPYKNDFADFVTNVIPNLTITKLSELEYAIL